MNRTKLRWNGWGFVAHKDELREEAWTWLADELGMPALLATPARPLEEIKLPPSALSQDDRAGLAAIVGADRVHDDAFERAFHARGRSTRDLLALRAGDLSAVPDAVVSPRGTEEVLAVLAFADEREIAVIPYGGGTSAVGGVTALSGKFSASIALDISEMDRLLAADAVSQTAVAQAGILGPALEKALAAKGFTLGHFPLSFEFSTLGGWIAHGGVGQASNRYGGAKDWLIGAKLATPRGLLATGDVTVSAAGPCLKDLLVGSEGMLGVITEASLRLHKLPETSEYRAYLFRDFDSGVATMREAMQAGIASAMLRLSDAEETRFLFAYSQAGKPKSVAMRLMQRFLDWRGYGAKPCGLMAGFEGDARSVAFARHGFDAIARKHGVLSFGRAPGEQWKKTRFAMPYLRDQLLDRGVGVDALETATSWSKFEALHASVRGALETAIVASVPREGAKGVVMGHIGHCDAQGASLTLTYLFPRALGGDAAQAEAIKKAGLDAVASHGGTLSHHHGVGTEHLPWIAAEKGEAGLKVLGAAKAALDPKGILNPGKLLPF